MDIRSETILRDKYSTFGADMESFKSNAKDMAGITKHLRTRAGYITLLSICNIPEHREPGKESFFILSDAYIREFLMEGAKLKIGTVPNEVLGEILLDEVRKTTGLVAIIDDDPYLVSDYAIQTLMMRSCVGGDSTANRQNLIRDMHVADCLYSRNADINVVYREITTESGATIKKIFGFMGRMFSPVSQTVLCGMADKVTEDGILGRMTVREWEISHPLTRIYLEFPECSEDFQEVYDLKDKVVPGLVLSTSDIGRSSIFARGVYRIGRSYVISDEIASKHTSGADAEKIIEKVEEEIFAKIRKFPETLCELLGKTVIDYDAVDISEERGARKNFDALSDLYEVLLNKFFKEFLGKKRTVELLECLKDEINTSIAYSLYDVAILFMGIPDRVEGLDDVTITSLRKSVAKVPYFINEYKPKTTGGTVTLLPL